MKNKTKNIILKIAYSSIFAALTFISTYFINIPYASGMGYFNLSDAIILFSSIYFGPLVGILSGVIGSSLADLLSGYYNVIIFTVIAKSLEALLSYLIYSKINNKILKHSLYYFSTLAMVITYFIYYLMMYDFNINTSLLSSLFDFIQGIINYLISLILIIFFNKINLINKNKKES